jgi:type I restriction enzyme S subunit
MSKIIKIPDGWEATEISKIATQIKSGGTPKSDNKSFYNGDIKFTTIEDITASNKYLYTTKKTITELGFNNSNTWLVGKDNLLYSIYATLGVPIITKTEVTTNQAILGIELNDNVDLEFIYYRLVYDKEQILSNATQTTQSNLNATIVKNTLLTLPKLKQEQQKIAEVLSEVDNAISKTEELFEKNKRLKTALMQDLLSYGVDENGKVRNPKTHTFKPSELGDIPEEWDCVELIDVCEDFIVPMRDKPKVFKGDIPWCKIEDFNGKYLSTTQSNQYVDEEIIRKMNLKVNPIDTVLCSCSAVIGITAIVKKPLIINQTFIGIVPNKVKLDSSYLYYLLPTYKKRFENLSSGTTIVYISRKQFEQFHIILPPKNEQQKIAQILSSQDEKIEDIKNKLNKLKSLKASLMQDLLSGKVRVIKLMEENS